MIFGGLHFLRVPLVGRVDEGLDLRVAPRPGTLKRVLDGRDRLPLGNVASVSAASTPRVRVLCLDGMNLRGWLRGLGVPVSIDGL